MVTQRTAILRPLAAFWGANGGIGRRDDSCGVGRASRLRLNAREGAPDCRRHVAGIEARAPPVARPPTVHRRLTPRYEHSP